MEQISQLKSSQKEFYDKNGYVIVSDLLNISEVEMLSNETLEIFKGKRGAIKGLLETNESESNDDILKKYVAIHFPHKISDIIYSFLKHDKIVKVLEEIVSKNVKCMQSMLFVKAPGKSGQSWHQDEFYIPTRDKSLVGAWIAIDDATIENGCLWLIPGSHKEGSILPRIKNENNNFADVDTVDVSRYSNENIIPVEVKKGSVIFFNGYILHSSLKNNSKSKFRTALVNHYMSAESMLPWDQDGKLPPTEDLRDVVIVAGVDPYAYKEIVDVNKPYLRPEILAIKSTI
nr:phytanoyl-CoA dioxygenase family protein [uncultured Flavobacterium sp.]